MTLTEARRVFDRYKDTPLDDDLKEAIGVAMTVLLEERPRKTASQRLAEIRQGIRETFDGFDPFCNRSRMKGDVIWRQAVFQQMRIEGYMLSEIAKASGYNHATVYFGCCQTTDGLDIGDYETKTVWGRLTEIVSCPDGQAT